MEEPKTINIEVPNTYKDHLNYVLSQDLDEMASKIIALNAEINKLTEDIAIDERALEAEKIRLKQNKEEFNALKGRARETRDLIDAIAPGSHSWNDLVKNL